MKILILALWQYLPGDFLAPQEWRRPVGTVRRPHRASIPGKHTHNRSYRSSFGLNQINNQTINPPKNHEFFIWICSNMYLEFLACYCTHTVSSLRNIKIRRDRHTKSIYKNKLFLTSYPLIFLVEKNSNMHYFGNYNYHLMKCF